MSGYRGEAPDSPPYVVLHSNTTLCACHVRLYEWWGIMTQESPLCYENTLCVRPQPSSRDYQLTHEDG